MSDNRWQRVEEIFHRTVDLAPQARSAFLDQACGADQSLRREVESLLAHESGDGATFAGEPKTIAHYRILGKLGEGGMGAVYRATDTKLGREVAIKVLPRSFADDPDRMARFGREAKVLASLNHPNIAQIYGLEEGALIMELVPGEPLKGPLPLDAALDYAMQIAEALEMAHEKGIVHRDLKPGNIVVTPDGVVKLLDFGLASIAPGSAEGDPAKSPTVTMQTTPGTIMGTAAYMSPEQAAGKAVDKRADVWSFGVVLWETLTGHRLFEEENISLTLASVLRAPIDFDKLPRETPAAIRNLLRRCLDRDVKNRLRDIGEARIALQEHPADPASEVTMRQRHAVPWTVAAVATLALATVSFLYLREKPAAPNDLPDLVLSIVPPSGRNLGRVGGLNVDRISPDGSTVLYRETDNRFHTRMLSSLQDQLIPPFRWYGDAFWAPDSKSVAFPTLTGLMKMQVPNGAPDVFTDISAARGGTWGDKGIILVAGYSPSGGISLQGVAADGGKAFPVEVPGFKEGSYYNPAFLPGSDDFLFLFFPLDSTKAQIFVATLKGAIAVDPRLLSTNETPAAFTSAGGGRILFVRNDNLYSQRLDLKARRLVGDTELVQERVVSNASYRTANFSVSNFGSLAWRSGTAVVWQVTVFDRKGNQTGTAGVPVPADVINLAPDEAHLLVSSEAGSWVIESNGPGITRLGSPLLSLWSSDGSEAIGVRGAEIVHRPVSGSHESLPLKGTPAIEGSAGGLNDISTDGRRILWGDATSLRWFSLAEHRSELVVEQSSDNAALSPDGAWTVYNPNTELGLYVQPLTNPGLRRQITNSGNSAVWRKDGKEIVYADQGRIWSVRIDGAGTQLHFAAPEPLFSVPKPLGLNSGSRPLAVSRDGSRIYFLKSTEEPDSGVIYVRTRAIR